MTAGRLPLARPAGSGSVHQGIRKREVLIDEVGAEVALHRESDSVAKASNHKDFRAQRLES